MWVRVVLAHHLLHPSPAARTYARPSTHARPTHMAERDRLSADGPSERIRRHAFCHYCWDAATWVSGWNTMKPCRFMSSPYGTYASRGEPLGRVVNDTAAIYCSHGKSRNQGGKERLAPGALHDHNATVCRGSDSPQQYVQDRHSRTFISAVLRHASVRSSQFENVRRDGRFDSMVT
jgi:hypothetical protein